MSLCQTKNLKQKHNKIRKRGCSSTSSSSIFSRKYRFKRAILLGKKSGYSTPAPIWKTSSKSPSMANHHHHHHHVTKNTAFHSFRSGLLSKEKETSVSARKLGATVWEINDLTPSRVKKESMKSNKDRDIDIEKVESLCRSMVLGPQKLDLDLSSNRLFSEKESNMAKEKKNFGKSKVGVKNLLKEAKSGLCAIKKLLKVLSQMVVEEKHSSRSMPVILAMSNELDHVHDQIDRFIQEQSSNQNNIEYLMKHFEEEKSVWKRREREKIREATTSIAQELEIEKKLRKQTERMNMKFANEIEKVKVSYKKLSKENEREKRAKEILEQVCDELGKGIGEDRAKVEDMKRESEKVREEVEKEREMLHLADVLREERVHMKLSEAKYQFEEKNAMLENLRNEVESLIKNKEKEKGDDDDNVEVEVDQGLKKLKGLEIYLNKTFFEFENLEQENDSIENEDESGESDLQSIELNMDNENKSYKWSYACENIPHFEAKRVSIDKDIGRRSFSDWGSICLNKGTNKSTKKKDFVGTNIEESYDHNLESGKSIEIVFGDDEIQKDKEENERYSYKPFMSLGDYISIPDSAKESGKVLSLSCIDGEAEENDLALEGCEYEMKKECAPRK